MVESAGNYFDYLVQQIAFDGVICKGRFYSRLLSFMHAKDFYWMPNFPLDSDRAEDGYALRSKFLETFGGQVNYAEFQAFCQSKKASILEVLVALCIRISGLITSENNGIVGLYFWHLLDNLGLSWANDRDFDPEVANDVFDGWMQRRYNPDGSGGNIFVFGNFGGNNFVGANLKNAREMNIWDQANLYFVKF